MDQELEKAKQQHEQRLEVKQEKIDAKTKLQKFKEKAIHEMDEN